MKTSYKLTLFNMLVLGCLNVKVSGGFNCFWKRSMTSTNYSIFFSCFPPGLYTVHSLCGFPKFTNPAFIFVLDSQCSSFPNALN